MNWAGNQKEEAETERLAVEKDYAVQGTAAQKKNIAAETENLNWKRNFILFLGGAAFCLVFSFIYHLFSHGVSSPYMTFLFLWPMALGAVPAFLAWGAEGAFPKVVPGPTAWFTWCEGVETLTMASLLRGIFEIAGTASVYQQYLMYAGWILIAAGIVLYLAGLIFPAGSIGKKSSHRPGEIFRTGL
ncbi:MAG: hypothetical protein U0L49_08760 [Eubacterium sp.]|nr:hypothetical protein [Eubacterium sp.]